MEFLFLKDCSLRFETALLGLLSDIKLVLIIKIINKITLLFYVNKFNVDQFLKGFWKQVILFQIEGLYVLI